MKTYTFGYSSLGLPIVAYEFMNGGPEILVLGGVHGDEIEGVWAAHGLLKSFLKSFPYKLNLTLVPQFNIEGVLNKTRMNARGVDLNRNLPTKDWSPEVKTPRYHPGPAPNSEPENQALVKFLEDRKPKFVLSLHSWHPMLNINGDCRKQAEAVSKITGYRIDPEMGYPTPGALGTYAGKERNMPTLTYEIERGLALEPVLKVHVPAILEMLKTCEV
jgi:murein peptide amidase A